tara:strand:- start:134 stop:430 length:297 start_codon:yes stop_codon:yes gene_type:complete
LQAQKKQSLTDAVGSTGVEINCAGDDVSVSCVGVACVGPDCVGSACVSVACVGVARVGAACVGAVDSVGITCEGNVAGGPSIDGNRILWNTNLNMCLQ